MKVGQYVAPSHLFFKTSQNTPLHDLGHATFIAALAVLKRER